MPWKYRGQVFLKNLKALEQRYRWNLSETGSQLIFSKSFIPMWLLLSSWRQYLIHLFWTVYNLLLNFLPLILFITFKAIASSEKLSSNSQPKYVTFEYCLILTSPYCMSKVPIFFFLFLVEKRIDLVLSPPKWMLNLLSTN